ncbi:MAG: isoaspartyl peptidase/L-asparaginase, partial [Bacteroidales bacterium]|nr:isoaspartyl peptidase/L-asparaginase [Bacteroidales bacterium]
MMNNKNINKVLAFALIMLIGFSAFAQQKHKYSIVIHGGAGTITKAGLTPEMEKAYYEKLNEALLTGEKLLKNGDSALSVVVKVIQIMEESPLFNAGKGAVFNHDGMNELDASIMDGKTLNAGAVAGVTDVKSPIELAFRVLSHSNHVMLSGKGASEFARSEGLEMVNNKYFYTKERWENLQKALKQEKKQEASDTEKHGTVGCAVLDIFGNLAAGTSTGGMTNKRYGRIGDSPVIGAGTYANNQTCAVSCTGHGEFFIRYVVAYTVSVLMQYNSMSLIEAADYLINTKLVEVHGNGGLIAVDKDGN